MIKRRFFNYKKYDTFLSNKEQIPEDAIVFIQDKACIWAHGKEYICDGPDNTNIAGNTITFTNGNDELIFTISLDNGTIEFTDSWGNTSSATYILKDTFDDTLLSIYSKIKTKANSTDIDELNAWRLDFVNYITGIIQNQPMRSELKLVAYTGMYDDLEGKPEIPTIDTDLNGSSTNPVQNKAVKKALDLKADLTALSGYVSNDQYIYDLGNKLNVLIPGYGISIESDVISSTLDTSVYLIVTELPRVDEADPNKIYLLETQNANGTFRYEQYRVRNGVWVSFDAVMPTVDLSTYLTKKVASETYLPIGSYLTPADLVPYAKLQDLRNIELMFNDYATYNYVDSTFLHIGDYATNDYVNETFVKHSEVYFPKQGEWGTDDSGSGGTWSEQPIIINTGSNVEVDNELSMSSSNPVENRIITRALNLKVNYSDLQDYATLNDIADKVNSNVLNDYVTYNTFEQLINTKQDTLTPGEGISIINNVISSTIDTNMWIIVDELPSTNINDNKIYLVEEEDDGEVIYTEWRHKDGEWVRSGLRMPEIDLSGYQRVGDYATNDQVAQTYLTKRDAINTYQPLGDYAYATDVANTYQEKGDYVEYDALEAFRINIDNTFQKRGGYALANDVSAALTTLQYIIDQKYALKTDVTNLSREITNNINTVSQGIIDEVSQALITLQLIIDLKYVLKKDVYQPDAGGFSTSEPTEIILNGSTASNPNTDFNNSDPNQITIGTSNGDGSSGGSSNSGTSGASNMVTLTTEQYEILVRANMVQENTYYFTYEGEAETDLWHFGDKFPIILTDLSTPDNIGTFPINLV